MITGFSELGAGRSEAIDRICAAAHRWRLSSMGSLWSPGLINMVLPDRIELSTSPLPRECHRVLAVLSVIDVPQKPSVPMMALFLVFLRFLIIFRRSSWG